MYNSLRNRICDCSLSVNQQYIGEMKLAKTTGIYPQFGFAVKNYINELVLNSDIFDFEQWEEKYKRINIAVYDKPENILMRKWFIQDTDIIIADVQDIPSVGRAYIRERLMKNFESVLATINTPVLIYASPDTYENALVFFIYHIDVDEGGQVDEAFGELVHENFADCMSEDLVATNFTYNSSSKHLEMKKHEEPKDPVDVIDDEVDDE